MKQVTTTQKLASGAILLLVLSVTGYVFAIRHMETLRRELSALREEMATQEKINENKLIFISLLNETKAGREELMGYYVPKDDPTPFLELVESVAQDAGVTLSVESLNVLGSDAKQVKTQSGDVRVVLTVEGQWERVHHFISLLEVMPYITSVMNATFTEDVGDTAGVWSGQIQLVYTSK